MIRIRFLREDPQDGERLDGVGRLVSDAAPRLRVDAERFDARLMREIRVRAAAPPAGPLFFPQRTPFRPLALAATIAIMVMAGVLSLMLGSPSSLPPAGAATQARGFTDDLSDLEDAVSSPREVPFMVKGDLVGARRGTIPLTTYVLEPPPDQAAVVRASL